MPKVDDLYFQRKREHILDSAFNVCMVKPVYSVSMKDIVKESGLSQGGVYKYFGNIDEIYTSLINKSNEGRYFKENLDKIFSENINPEEVISNVFFYLGEYIDLTIDGYSKVYFEIRNILIKDHDRYKKISSNIEVIPNLEYIIFRIFEYIEVYCKNNYFNDVDIDDFKSFINVSIYGIINEAIVEKCYKNNEKFSTYKLIKILSKSIKLILSD